MSRPLFEVGEEVIVVPAEARPRIFEAVVHSITRGSDWGSGRAVICYFVRPDPDDEFVPWNETCLRKKYKPGDSFDTLMTNLKNPQRIEA